MEEEEEDVENMQEFSWGEARTVILTNVSEMIKLNMYIIVISIMLC